MSPSEASPPSVPRVSVMIAAYEAHQTVGRCLESLRGQTFRDFEVILVDSLAGGETAGIARAFPEVRLDRSGSRLYPHEARNGAAAPAASELLVSIDADVYSHPGVPARRQRHGEPNHRQERSPSRTRAEPRVRATGIANHA